MDGDLDPLYTTINALDDANIADDAAIKGTKIDPTTFADGSIPAAKVSAIPGAQLVGQSVTPAQLALNASLNAYAEVAVGSPTVIITNLEQDIATLPAITTRGGRVRLEGGVTFIVEIAPTALGTINLKWYRDGVVIGPSAAGFEYPLKNENSDPIRVPITVPPLLIDTPAAGAHTYKLAGIGSAVTTLFAVEGNLYASELS